jgi:hypothetical protein
MLALLVTGFGAGAAVLFSLKRPGTRIAGWAAALLTSTAAILALADFIFARSSGSLASNDVPWLNITLIALAIVFWLGRGRERQNS